MAQTATELLQQGLGAPWTVSIRAEMRRILGIEPASAVGELCQVEIATPVYF